MAVLEAGAKLLIKPIINQLKREAARRAAKTGAANALGLGVRDINKLTNLDVVNLVRAKVVKGTKKQVADSLGITVKELNATLNDITLSETRKKAVKGANYIKNVKRFVNDPVKYGVGEGKRKATVYINKQVNEIINPQDDKFETGEWDSGADQRLELDLLQETLWDVNKGLTLPPYLWDNAEKYDVDHIRMLRFLAELDMSATVSATSGLRADIDFFVVVTPENGGKGGGYKQGITVEDYIQHVTSLIEDGYDEIKYTDGIL